MAQLMHYRFCEGTLAGQSFGNLFLAALNGIMPSFDRAVESMSQVLAITGRVLPVTTADVQLEATFENGASVVGESRIFRCKKEQDCRHPPGAADPGASPGPCRRLWEALEEAEVIVLAPGSLYTSIIPNLLVDGLVTPIQPSPGTEGLCLQRHDPGRRNRGLHGVRPHPRPVQALLPGAVRPVPDQFLPHSPAVVQRYAQEGAEPIFATGSPWRPWGWRSSAARCPR